jgi:lipoprotein signal peptidase
MFDTRVHRLLGRVAVLGRNRIALTATVVVGLDQLTKPLAPLMRVGAVLPLRNRGLLLGLAGGNRFALALVMLVVLAGCARPVLRRVHAGTLSPVAAGLLFGGAVANLIDRAALGSVRDFIVIGHAIVVNVADVAVVIGLVLYALAPRVAGTRTGLATVEAHN